MRFSGVRRAVQGFRHRLLNMDRSTKITILEILGTLVLALVVFLVVQSAMESREVEGACMEPNLYTGQRVLVLKSAYWFGDPQRGDVIIFTSPADPDRTLIKRVIGLPGENISIIGGDVYIDGSPLAEPYTQGNSHAYPLTAIPDDSYFVMGDNRERSTDSRNWGVLPRENIIGKAWLCYWPLSDWHLVRGCSYADDQ